MISDKAIYTYKTTKRHVRPDSFEIVRIKTSAADEMPIEHLCHDFVFKVTSSVFGSDKQVTYFPRITDSLMVALCEEALVFGADWPTKRKGAPTFVEVHEGDNEVERCFTPHWNILAEEIKNPLSKDLEGWDLMIAYLDERRIDSMFEGTDFPW